MKKKRNLFAELSEGFSALGQSREGKLTLRTYKAPRRDAPEISAQELVALRERLTMSRPVFASCLRTNARTIENWEQGRVKPNAQAVLLLKLVDKYPDTIERLTAV